MNRIGFGLSIIPLFTIVACVHVATISCGSGRCNTQPPPLISDENSDSASPELDKISPSSSSYPQTTVIAGGPDVAPLCQLSPPLSTFQKQDNSAWCWAASTTLIIDHLEPNRHIKQCEAVQTTLTPERKQYEEEVLNTTGNVVSVDCCRVTDRALEAEDPTDKNIIGSKIVCHTTFRPEWALNALGYENRFQLVRWDPGSTQPQGLSWEELTGQICGNLPFISVKLWDEGGTHSEVVTGYHFAPDAYVDLDTHGMDTFFSEPYDDYLGKPGDWVHVRDYVNIGL